MMVRVLPGALNDLNTIDAYVSESFGASAAARTIAKLLDSFQLIGDFPGLGTPRRDVTKRPVRFFLVRPYWIVYEPGEPLLIHRVYHSARDLKRLPQT